MLTEEVKVDLKQLERQWEKLAKEVRKSMEWKTTKIYQINQISKDTKIISEVLEAGDSSSLATGTSKLSDVEISLHYLKGVVRRGTQKQRALCLILHNICSSSSTTEVDVNKVLKTNGYLRYIDLKVNDDYDFVAKTLRNKSISFYFKLKIRKKTIVEKYFTIRLSNQQGKRSVWSAYKQYSIPYEYLMPDYNQHMCCGGCYSGCTPVAWAQIFAYYDIIAHKYSGYGYSKATYQGVYGHYGSKYYVAPSTLDYKAKMFIIHFRAPLHTFCVGQSGATRSSSSSNLDSWYRRRQSNGKVRRLGNKAQVTSYVKKGYPVMNNIWWIGGGDKKNKAGHSVVVTKVKQRSRSYQVCRKVGWWTGRKTKCTSNTEYEYLWYRRLGWGGSQNNWYQPSLTSAFVAVHT